MHVKVYWEYNSLFVSKFCPNSSLNKKSHLAYRAASLPNGEFLGSEYIVDHCLVCYERDVSDAALFARGCGVP